MCYNHGVNVDGAIVLQGGREKKIRHFYPWVQRGEIASTQGNPTPGALVHLLDSGGEFLGIGLYNPQSRFPVRVLTLQDELIDSAFFASRFRNALSIRERWARDTNAYRLLFSEADQVSGLIIDRYDRHLTVQVRALGMERLKPVWLPALLETLDPLSVWERSDMEGRREEGLPPHTEALYGEPPDDAPIIESGLKFLAPTRSGLKTGFYLDQRENRRLLAAQVLPGETVLDMFCYTGAFALYAARAGACVLGVDIVPDHVERAEAHAAMNGLVAQFECANAFDWLAAPRDTLYDWILLDPPAIAKERKQRDSLKWAVWKLAYLSLPLLKPGGRLVVSACSYQFPLNELIETVRMAASDRETPLYLDQVTLQPPDHPALTQFPESLYLKTGWFRKG